MLSYAALLHSNQCCHCRSLAKGWIDDLEDRAHLWRAIVRYLYADTRYLPEADKDIEGLVEAHLDHVLSTVLAGRHLRFCWQWHCCLLLWGWPLAGGLGLYVYEVLDDESRV